MLEKQPAAEIAVYTVWFSVLPGDQRDRWPATALSDDRVAEYWAADLAIGEWFAQQYGFHTPIAYDVYYVFDANARWDANAPELIDTGYTVLGRKDRLKATLDRLLDTPL